MQLAQLAVTLAHNEDFDIVRGLLGALILGGRQITLDAVNSDGTEVCESHDSAYCTADLLMATWA